MGWSRLHFKPIGMEIPEHRHRPPDLSDGRFSTMKVLHRIKQAILIIHQPINLIAGAIGLRKLESQIETGGIGN